ncbi:MAG TPA: sulfurtransferase [Chloroflexota bacterium]
MDEPVVVDPGWLASRIDSRELAIVDVRPPPYFVRGHILGAVNLPIFLFNGPNGVPPHAGFAEILGRLGVTSQMHVVVYDDGASPSAARLFWVLSYYRHARLSVLDGGIRAWVHAGNDLESGEPSIKFATYHIAEPDHGALADTESVLQSLNRDDAVIVDTRSESEYSGWQTTAARNGHIPGAVHLEWIESFEQRDGCLHLRESRELLARYAELGITPDRPVFVHCQSGMRAAQTFLTLKHLGYARVAHYSAGWQEWGNRFDTPVETE